MAKMTKISVSLPTPLIDALKAEAKERGMLLSQLMAQELAHRSKAADVVHVIDEIYGPFTDEDREAGRAWLASARTPDQTRRSFTSQCYSR